jgi:hypothetical protein
MLKSISTTVLAFLCVSAPRVAHACAVCFGAANVNQSRAFFWGILVLLFLPFTLAGFFVGWIAYHSRRHHRQHGSMPVSRMP